jgi:hypothetical protein
MMTLHCIPHILSSLDRLHEEVQNVQADRGQYAKLVDKFSQVMLRWYLHDDNDVDEMYVVDEMYDGDIISS